MSKLAQPPLFGATTDEIIKANLEHHIHPYSPVKRGADAAPLFQSAEGLQLIDIHGNDWIDACSVLLNVNIGYGRAELAEAAEAAMRELSYTRLPHEVGECGGLAGWIARCLLGSWVVRARIV
jgi:adenosylmethionine-8-amino-7-oxononanoate aminotransferase